MTNHAITAVLDQSKNILGDVLTKVGEIKQCNQVFTDVLRLLDEESLIQNCRVANFENNVLCIAIEDAHAETQFRFQAPDIFEKLKKHFLFQKLQKIEHFIVLKEKPEDDTIPHKIPLGISNNIRQLLKQTAKNIKNKKLKDVIRKIVD